MKWWLIAAVLVLGACTTEDDAGEGPATPDAQVADAQVSPDSGAADAAPMIDAAVALDAGLEDPDQGAEDPDQGAEDPDQGAEDPDQGAEDPDQGPDEPDQHVEGPHCPPSGPFGTNVGDVVPDVMLPDCEGNMHSIHAACGEPLWIFEFAGWCPPCRAFAGRIEALWTAVGRDRVQPWFVIAATSDFSPPSAAACRQIRDQYGLTMPVLYDADGVLQRTLGVPANDVNLVIDAEGTLVFDRHHASTQAVQAAIEGL